MAEVLGTVVGVISLGIQVSSAIGAYIEGVQCRKEEVESTRRYQKSFQVLLTQIGSLKDHLLKSSISNTAALEEALKAANAQIAQLDGFLGKILVPDHSSSSKDQLDAVEQKLEATNIAFQSAMQVMELEMSVTVQASVYQIQKETTTTNSVLLDIKNNIDRGTMYNQSNNLATKTDMDELKSVVEALVSSNSDTTMILKKLMSKPDALKVVCRELPNEQPHQSLFRPNKISDDLYSGEADGLCESLYCNCNTRRGLKRTTRRSGPAFLIKEVLVEKPHFSWCPLGAPVYGQGKWSVGISARMLRGLASVALTITTSTILGAGGFAISPSFTYLSIRDTSPARKALRLLGNAFDDWEWSDEDCKSLIWRTIKTIQTSFNSRTSSPYDIDNSGNTLLHDVMISWSRSGSKLPRNEIVKYLSGAGVPRDRPNQARIYPFQAALHSSTAVHTPPTHMFRMLCPDDCLSALDIQQAKTYGSKGWATGSLKAHAEIISQCPEFFELYSGHPTEAIISRNAAALRYVLDRNVSLSELSELDAFGNNSLNHLLSWPEGLKIVLDCFGSRVFDTPGETLILEYALFWSGYICDPNASAKCREDCACTYVVKLIMDMDIECLAKTTGRHFWMTSVAHASVKARELLIVHLRDAKQELKALALTHLAPQEIEEWDLRSPSILDYHTNSVLAALDHRKQHVPYRLVTNRGEDYEDYYTSFSITS
ncbi:hypothetical protein CGGC5_v006879 [Colletotrichum fructicola Nara gc5]|uniref:Fungal N-terminal domain-containing protein n=1 Tax=Colletotrichum fructicola (strain Nara gc5) TaxID=1213859 RepID=A0A7J6J680_COLFN|nr:hypothetical protein CGGC5_v006879 [Colletotrichum fructicola Nara gc5]